MQSWNGVKAECGAVHPAFLAAGNPANIGMGLTNPAFQRAIISYSGLAHWFPMDPEANWTVLANRRSQIAWVYTLYLLGFHLIHYPFENLQRSLDNFTVGLRLDPASPNSVHGRRDAWNLWLGICGEHLQGVTSIKVDGRKIRNPDYYGDED